MAARVGDEVKVHYVGTTDGQQFDSSYERGEPLEFTLGARQVVAGFESAVLGMELGEKKTVDIPASQAYGPRNQDMVLSEDISELPPGIELGVTLVGRDSDTGEELRFEVVAIEGDRAILDANHPLSGRDLTFQLELVEIVESLGAEMPWGGDAEAAAPAPVAPPMPEPESGGHEGHDHDHASHDHEHDHEGHGH